MVYSTKLISSTWRTSSATCQWCSRVDTMLSLRKRERERAREREGERSLGTLSRLTKAYGVYTVEKKIFVGTNFRGLNLIFVKQRHPRVIEPANNKTHEKWNPRRMKRTKIEVVECRKWLCPTKLPRSARAADDWETHERHVRHATVIATGFLHHP